MHILEIGAEQEDEGGSSRAVDAAFRTVPKDHTTFLVWRITESGTELLPRTHFGTFYDGDAYLIYSSSLPGQPAGPDVIRREIKESGECAERHVHAWAGERSGALAAAALRRGAQLATHLAAPVVIHREAATKESPRLLSYFKDGIRILRSGSLNGGARLYRVKGRRPILIQLEPVSWSQLAADGVFVLDTSALLVLWLGRTASLIEKIFGAKIAYRMARGADKGMTARRIAIAHDGYEQTLPTSDRALLDALLELRARSVRPAAPPADPPRPARLYKATQPPRPPSVTMPSQRPAARLEEVKRAPLFREDLADDAQLPDDGSGALRVWRVRREGSPSLVEVERPQAAVFYDRDCYIALYTYHAPTGDQSILYYWMGGSSPNDLRNLGAKEAKDLYINLGRLPVQAWIYQGKEPAHFLQIFKGRMVTYVGSATDYDPTGRRVVAPSRALIRVSGQYAREARGVEVRGGAGVGGGAGGGRGACYLLREGARVWVWCAATATGDEREVAKNMAAAEHVLVMQGKENAHFWAALGERSHLLVAAPLKEVERPLPARLFYVALGVPGQYSFEEIISFSQYDLAPEMAAVLDAHCAVFVWLGAHCCARAKDAARAIAEAYLAQDPAARDPETPVLVLSQGREPPNFTGFFPHWKQSMWKGHKTFSAIISALEGKAIVQGGNSAIQSGNTANRFDQYEKYPLAVLRGPKDHLPPDVDPLTKELYLTHDDFVATFSMPYNEFRSLPGWKQKDLKKAVGLF